MRFFKRLETADSHFTFLDTATNQPIDINDPRFTVVYYDGPVEVSIIPYTTMTKLPGKIGEYIVNWEIPGNALENETYFVYATGIHPVDLTMTIIEDFYRVVAADFFGGGSGGSGSGLQIKFTKA